jgi:fumarate reductase flavoprotein subunit
MKYECSNVVVIGGGLAGLVAAVRAAELELRVIVLEAGIEERYLCNSRLAMGFFNVAFRGVDEGEAVLARAIEMATAGTAERDLAQALSRNARPALDWLRSRGVRLIRGSGRVGNSAMLVPPAAIGAGLRWPGRGADQTLRRLEALLIASGGRLLRGVRARELIMVNGRCSGVIADCDGDCWQFMADAVLIADGGFQNSPDLLREFVTPRPDRLLMRNAGTARGDGLLMARAIGAKIAETRDFYGHVQSADAFRNPRLWPYPTLDLIIAAGVLVDAQARRFADEGMGGVFVANAIARQKDPLGSFVIFDRPIWESRARDFPLPVNPLLATCGARIHAAHTLEELATSAGVPSENLIETIAEYNCAVRNNTVHLLDPIRSTELVAAMPIAQSPFFATQAVAGITYTMGGIAVDGDARVKHHAGGTINGLFAAGSATGGHEGGPTCGYTGGLSKALTFGWTAAHTISAERRRAVALGY